MGWSKDPGPPSGGEFPRHFRYLGEMCVMGERSLSVFIDESGDFGPFSTHSPYYFVAMVFHDQSVDIRRNIDAFETHLTNLGYACHAVHTGPLIRRESVYANDFVEDRKRLYNALFNFVRKLDIQYASAMVKKAECTGELALISKLSSALASILRDNSEFLNRFERIVVYYDNGQVELTKILTSVFHTLYTQVEFRKVRPVEYKLFQVADLICTTELLAEKPVFSRSELDFFNNKRDFCKNYLKTIRKKRI